MDGVIVILFALNYFSFPRQSHSYLNCLVTLCYCFIFCIINKFNFHASTIFT